MPCPIVRSFRVFFVIVIIIVIVTCHSRDPQPSHGIYQGPLRPRIHGRRGRGLLEDDAATAGQGRGLLVALWRVDLWAPQARMVSPGDVAHHSDDSTVRPPQTPTSFIVVHRGRAITLIPGELPFPSVSEEGITGVIVVGISLGIHPMLRRELVVE